MGGCPGGDDTPPPPPVVPETPQLRSESVTFDFGGSGTVKGTLTEAEWTAALAKIKEVINDRYDALPYGALKDRFNIVFAMSGIIITVEKTEDYENWKTEADEKTLFLNYNAMDNWYSVIGAAVTAMYNETASQAKALDKSAVRLVGGWQKMNGQRFALSNAATKRALSNVRLG